MCWEITFLRLIDIVARRNYFFYSLMGLLQPAIYVYMIHSYSRRLVVRTRRNSVILVLSIIVFAMPVKPRSMKDSVKSVVSWYNVFREKFSVAHEINHESPCWRKEKWTGPHKFVMANICKDFSNDEIILKSCTQILADRSWSWSQFDPHNHSTDRPAEQSP